jgi:hypothetical protein
MIGSLPEPPAGERQLVSLDEKLTSRVTLFRRANGGGIAQLVERLVRNEKVRGSNPLASISKSN